MEKKEVLLTEELRQKLKACSAINIKSDFRYVPKVFREKNESGEYIFDKSLWTVFKLKGLDGIDLVKAEDDGIVDVQTDANGKVIDIKLKAGSIKIGFVRRGLLGWKNLLDENLNLLPDRKFTKNNPCSEDDLKILNPSIIAELYSAIEGESKLSEEELLGLD
jgi:hypothetical protein